LSYISSSISREREPFAGDAPCFGFHVTVAGLERRAGADGAPKMLDRCFGAFLTALGFFLTNFYQLEEMEFLSALNLGSTKFFLDLLALSRIELYAYT